GLGGILHEVQQEVERDQEQTDKAATVERRRKQAFDKTTWVVDFYAVVERKQQHTQGHPHGDVKVCSGQDSVVVQRIAMLGADAGYLEQPGQQIDRNQVQRVHENDPE